MGQEREVGGVRREAKTFPTDVRERFSCVIRVVKSATLRDSLGLLPPAGEYAEPDELTERLNGLYAGTPMAGLRGQIVTSYYKNSLCEVGMVAEAYEINHARVPLLLGFGLTEAGMKYGVRAAILASYFEWHYGISLFAGLGQTGSAYDLSAPYARARILLLLGERDEPLREVDIEKRLGFGHGFLSNGTLGTLRQVGWIDYEAITPHTGKVEVGFVRGVLPREAVKQVGTMRQLTQTVADACQGLTEEGRPITLSTVVDRVPSEIKANWQPTSERNVRTVLNSLVGQGYLNKGKFGDSVFSEARLTDTGRLVRDEFVLPLLGLVCDLSSVIEWIDDELSPQVRTNRGDCCQAGVELYYPFSIRHKKLEFQRVKLEMVEILGIGAKEASRGITAIDLATRLNRDRVTMRRLLGELIEQNIVERTRRKGVDYYRLVGREE